LRDDVQEETEVIMPTYCNRSEYKWFPKVVKASTIRWWDISHRDVSQIKSHSW